VFPNHKKMDLKLVLCLSLVLVGVSLAVPAPPQLTELVIPPPQDWGVIHEACLIEDKECPERAAKAEKDHETKRLEEMNNWVAQMSPYGKEHWKEQYPEAAEEMEKLSG